MSTAAAKPVSSTTTGLSVNEKVVFKTASDLDIKVASAAIKALNAPCGFTQYDDFIESYMLEKPTNVHFAELEGTIVGYSIYKPEKHMLSYIAVDPSVRKAHIGSTLMDKVITTARDLGEKTITWDYRDKADGPGPFYDRILSALSGVTAEKTAAGTFRDGTPKIQVTLTLP